MTLTDIPTYPVAAAAPDTPVHEALAIMRERRIGALVVVEANRPVGIFTERDAVRLSAGRIAFDRTPLARVMSQPVHTVESGQSLQNAISHMDRVRTRRLVVVDERGTMVGLVTRHEIAKLMNRTTWPPTSPSARTAAPKRDGRSARPSRPWIAALVATLLILAAEQGIERLEHRGAVQRERMSVHGTLSVLRARLEGIIAAHRLLVHGLSAAISAQPDMSQAGFERIARGLVNEHQALRHVVGAPDLVISLIYPREGNTPALGLDYRTHPTQRAAALRAIEAGSAVLAGPLALAQGGLGFVARQPVYVPAERPGEPPRLWGLVAGIFDADALYRRAGLDRPAEGLRLGLRGTDGSGATGPVFFGDPRVYAQDPVTEEVSVPGGTWQLAAAPSAGWGQADAARWAIRLSGLLLALAVAAAVHLRGRWELALAYTTARLRDSQDIFERFMDQLPAGVFIREPRDGAQVFENRWLRERFRTGTEAAGRGIPGVAAAMAENGLAADRRTLSEGSLRIEERLNDAAGQAMTCDSIRFLIPRAEGPPLVGGVVLDITDRVEAQRRLADSEARLRALLDAIPDLVWLKDPNGVYLACNPRCERLFGAPESEILGRTDEELVSAEQAESFRINDRAAIAAGGPRIDEAWLTFADDGHRELTEIIYAPIYDGAGTLIGVLGIGRDTTERKSAEVAIRQLNAELEDRVRERTAELSAANKELETFTYSVSHDLKAPLRGIDGYSRLLLEDHQEGLNEEGRLFLANVRRSVTQMHELIDDLLTYSRMERRALQQTSLNLQALAGKVLAEREAEIADRGVEVSVDLAGLRAQADPDGLAMVLRNLLDNALKFGRDRQPLLIGIGATATEGSVILHVRDNGIGFDMQFQERIFEIFQRLQRAEQYPGTGIGLAIVRKAVQRMGGRIWAKSAPGHGATFFVELKQ